MNDLEGVLAGTGKWANNVTSTESHLLEALENPAANPVGEADGGPISWVMSLAAPHSSFYTTMLAGRQHLAY